MAPLLLKASMSALKKPISNQQNVQHVQMSGWSLPCNGFSIRAYVAEVRKGDIKKCWPFHPQLFESRLKDGANAILPSLEVHTYKYWKCLDREDDDDPLNAEQLIDASENNTALDGHGKVLPRLPENTQIYSADDFQIPELEVKSNDILKKDRTTETEVAEYLSVATRSEKTCLENNVMNSCETDGIVEQNAMEQLSGKRILLDLEGAITEASCSLKESLLCNATLGPRESELCFHKNQRVCSGEKGYLFFDHAMDQVASELGRLNIVDKADILSQFSVTMHSVRRSGMFERTGNGNEIQITAKNHKEQVICETPATHKFNLTPGENVQKDYHITQVSRKVENDRVLPKIKETVTERPKEKRQSQKKRLMADLVALPSEQIMCNEAESNCTVEYTEKNTIFGIKRRKIISKQGLSQAPAHNLRKIRVKRQCACGVHFGFMKDGNVPDKPLPESFDKKRKWRCQQPGFSALSSFSIDMKRKQQQQRGGTSAPLLPLTESGEESSRVIRRGLVASMPERHRVADYSRASGKKVEKYIQGRSRRQTHAKQDKDVQVDLTNHSTRQDGLAKEDAFRHTPTDFAAKDGLAHLVLEGSHQSIRCMHGPHMPEKLNVSGQANESRSISETEGGAIISDEKDHSVTIPMNGSLNFDRGVHVHSVGDQGDVDDSVVRKELAGHKSINKLKNLIKSSDSHYPFTEETNIVLKAVLSNGNLRKPLFVSDTIQGSNNGWKETPLSCLCKDMPTDTAHTVAEAGLARELRVAGRGIDIAQTLNQPVLDPLCQDNVQRAANNSCIRFPLNLQGRLINPIYMVGKNTHSEISHPAGKFLSRSEGCLKSGRTIITPATGCNSRIRVLHQTSTKKSFPSKPITHFMNRVARGGVNADGQVMEQASNKHAPNMSSVQHVMEQSVRCMSKAIHEQDTWLPQPPNVGTSISVSGGFAVHSSSVAVPTLQGSPEAPLSQHFQSSKFHNSLGCVLPYVMLNSPSNFVVK